MDEAPGHPRGKGERTVSEPVDRREATRVAEDALEFFEPSAYGVLAQYVLDLIAEIEALEKVRATA